MARISNPLESGFEQARKSGGGIQPTKRDSPSTMPMDALMGAASKVGRAILGGLKRINSSGNRTSPTTKQDQ